ncbi:MAG: aminotransferase class I/II-fold pyridoxal phosphate-dependent enzyme [Pseudomonadota bacterium]
MKRIFLSSPHLDVVERTLLLDALDSNWIAPLGPHVDAFEREICQLLGVEHAVALCSGTAALHLALIVLGVGTSDSVAVSTLTFSAPANAVTYCGATPVFIDAASGNWNMDPALLEEELDADAKRGTLPKAVIAVDLYGQCADYAAICRICDYYSVPLIEDAAEALGARYCRQQAGSFGKVGVLSFNGNKIITTSGGGMLVSSDGDLVKRARFLSTQARDAAPYYQHSHIGYNYRLSNLLAAVGRGQLQVLEKRIEKRREIHSFYRRTLGELPGISFMPQGVDSEWNAWLTCILVDPVKFGTNCEQIRLHLEEHNIEARPMWKPMHLQPVFRQLRCRGGAVAEELFSTGLCLPSGSNLSDEDLERVVTAIRTTPRKLSQVRK